MSELEHNHKKMVDWFCTCTPEEMIYAAGFSSYRALPQSNKGDSSVENALPGNICPSRFRPC